MCFGIFVVRIRSNLEAASESVAVFTPPIRLPKECEKAACLLPLQRGRITARTGIVASVRNRPSYGGVFALVLTGSRGQAQAEWDRAETMAIAFVVDNHRKGIKCIADAKGAVPLLEPAAATSAPVQRRTRTIIRRPLHSSLRCTPQSSG